MYKYSVIGFTTIWIHKPLNICIPRRREEDLAHTVLLEIHLFSVVFFFSEAQGLLEIDD